MTAVFRSVVVGVSHETVAQDLKAPVRNLTPAPVPTFDPTPAWDPMAGEVVEARTVTGLDGKTYTRPAPPEDEDDMPQKITRKRTPYPLVVDRAAADVATALERRGQGTFRGHEH